MTMRDLVGTMVEDLDRVLEKMRKEKITTVDTVQAGFARGNIEDEFTGALKDTQAYQWLSKIRLSLARDPQQKVFVFDYNNQATEDAVWCHVPLWMENTDIAITTVRTLESKAWKGLQERYAQVNPITRGTSICTFSNKETRAFFSDQPGSVASYGRRFAKGNEEEGAARLTLRLFRVPPRSILVPHIQRIWNDKPEGTVDIWIRHPEKPSRVPGVSNFTRSVPSKVPDLEDLLLVGPVRLESPVEEIIMKDQQQKLLDESSDSWEPLDNGLELMEELQADDRELYKQMKSFDSLQQSVEEDDSVIANLVEESDKIREYIRQDIVDESSVGSFLEENLLRLDTLMNSNELESVPIGELRDTIENLRTSMDEKHSDLWEGASYHSALAEKLEMFDYIVAYEQEDDIDEPDQSIDETLKRLKESPIEKIKEITTNDNRVDMSEAASSVDSLYEGGLKLFDRMLLDKRSIDYLPTHEVECFIEKLKPKDSEREDKPDDASTHETAIDSTENSSINPVYQDGLNLLESLANAHDPVENIPNEDLEGMLVKLQARMSAPSPITEPMTPLVDKVLEVASEAQLLLQSEGEKSSVNPVFQECLELFDRMALNESYESYGLSGSEMQETLDRFEKLKPPSYESPEVESAVSPATEQVLSNSVFDFEIDTKELSSNVNLIEADDVASVEPTSYVDELDIVMISPIKEEEEEVLEKTQELFVQTKLPTMLSTTAKLTFSNLSVPVLSSPMASPFALGTPMNRLISPINQSNLISPNES